MVSVFTQVVQLHSQSILITHLKVDGLTERTALLPKEALRLVQRRESQVLHGEGCTTGRLPGKSACIVESALALQI